MTTAAGRIKANPEFSGLIKRQSNHLLGINTETPRLASIFACQDRWLMAHVGMALHFENARGPGREDLNAANFTRHVRLHQVTSRNTASAFLNEMINYGIITQRQHASDRRKRVMEPAPKTIEALGAWILLHLSTLDALDGGQRCAWYLASPEEILARLQPLIAAALLRDATIRKPHPAFAHFMWMTSGFLVTERLFVSIVDADAEGDRLQTSLTSVADLTAGLNISRSHSARKVGEAEEQGFVGWNGAKGRSPMWVSADFVAGFLDVQAAKLAIIDHAVGTVRRNEASAPLFALAQ